MKSFVYLDDEDYAGRRSCHVFSAAAAIATVVGATATAASITAVGAGLASAIGATAATALGGAALGAGVGALGAGITGSDPLKGAEMGGLSGLGAGAGLGLAGGTAALGTAAGEEASALGGALGGGIGGAATGSSPLLGALEGGVSGYLGAVHPLPGTSGVTGTSAAATAAPVGTATGGATDLATQSTSGGGFLSNIGNDISKGVSSLETGAKNLFSGGATPTTGSASLLSPNGTTGMGLDVSAVGSTGLTGGGTQLTTDQASSLLGGGSSSSLDLAATATTGGTQLSTAQSASLLSGADTAVGGATGLLGGKITPTEVSALGLGYDVLKGTSSPNLSAMGGIAGQLSTQGAQYEQYLSSGTLPSGAQNAIDTASQSSKAAIRQQYQAMGLAGSTAEQQALAAVDTQATQQGTNLAYQLMNQGVDESHMASMIYSNLVGAQTNQNAGMSDAVANFAKTLAGGTLAA